MPKKDTAATVLGMLSTVGAQTRVAEPEVADAVTQPMPPVDDAIRAPTESVHLARVPQPSASVGQVPPAPSQVEVPVDKVPRTFRLKPATAGELRAAWLEAKRDDVLLTAQDFATVLVEEALAARRRRARAAGSR